MEFETPTFSRPRRRRIILLVALLVVVFAVTGFLIGYFVMKAGQDAVKCQTDDGSDNTSKPTPTPSNKEKYHKMFQEEIKAKNIEDNLK